MSTQTHPTEFVVSDTKLAAALAFLGYPCDYQSTIHHSTLKRHVQFLFDDHTDRFPGLPPIRQLVSDYRRQQLDQTHLLMVAMRANANYDAVLRMQKDNAPHALALLGDGIAYNYRAGPARLPHGETRTTDDICLAAACAEIGLEIHAITRANNRHAYTIAAYGLPLGDVKYAFDGVTARTPSPDDEYRLALEDATPTHPLVVAYGALRCRAILKKAIDRQLANLLLDDSGRQALIHQNASGRVLDHVANHFKTTL